MGEDVWDEAADVPPMMAWREAVMSTTSSAGGTGGPPSSIMEGKIPVFVFPVQLGMAAHHTASLSIFFFQCPGNLKNA